MSDPSKSIQALGIPFAALVSVIFGLMIFSFPVGAYVFFNSDLETDIHFDYPVNPFNFISAGDSEFSISQFVWILFTYRYRIPNIQFMII